MHAQRLIDRNGQVSFFSDAPLEDISALNRQAMAVIDFESGEVAVSMLIRGFQFEKSLMQEHFNENYMESDQFPKATFSGNLKEYDPMSLADGEIDTRLEVSGELTIHGVTKPLTAQVSFKSEDDIIYAEVKFQVRVADHDIDIPTLVIKNIAEVVDVTAKFHFNRNQNP